MVKNYFIKKGQPDAARAIHTAAVQYGEDSVEFNNTLQQLSEDVKEDIIKEFKDYETDERAGIKRL